MDDDWFSCTNCGADMDLDDMTAGEECEPCVVCNNVHTCNVTVRVTPTGKVTTHGKRYDYECECCWLASK